MLLSWQQHDLLAQDQPQSTKTGNTSVDSKPVHKIEKNKDLRLHWIKNDTKGLLIGNRCFEEVTNKMGFVYHIQTKSQSNQMSETRRLLHNFGVKFKLFFKNGPFWKFKLKKKRKECKQITGDFTF